MALLTVYLNILSLQVVLAMLVMPTLGWRWLLALSSVPSLCFLLVCAWLPESPRYMATGGHSDQAYSASCNFLNFSLFLKQDFILGF
jgi:hypothetical protein